MRSTPALALLLLAGCPGPTPTAELWKLQQKGEPITVSVTTEDAAAVSADVPLTGGKLTTTAPDGTVYALEIPANALLAATRITMTPVRAVTGLPFGGGETSLGVQFAPDGLEFFNPPTLTITPPADKEIPVGEQVFVEWLRKGEALALAIPERGTRALKMRVLHFSGYAVARSKSFAAEVSAARDRLGGAAERRIQSAIAERLGQERAAQTLGQEPTDTVSAIYDSALWEEYLRDVVRPRIAAAGTSCAAGNLALITVLGVERQRIILGLESTSSDYVQLVPIVAEVCMREEYEICRDEHVIVRIIPQWFSLQRTAYLLGFPENPFEHLYRYVDGCLRFELDFRSVATAVTSAFSYSETVRTQRLRIRFTNAWTFIGSGPLISQQYDVTSMQRCAEVVSPTRVGSTFDVVGMTWVPILMSENISDFSLEFSPGAVGSNFRVRDTCANPMTTSMPLEQNHTVAWTPLATTLYESGMTGYVVKGFTVMKAEKIGFREVVGTQSMGGASLQIRDTFDLFHRPSLD